MPNLNRRRLERKRQHIGVAWLLLLPALCLIAVWDVFAARPKGDDISDITGKYEFLSADDTLAILEEDGKLKGYVDVYQGQEESDAVLSYPIASGTHQKAQIEFQTGKIHQKYYRFSGTVERGRGHKESDPDYLRLIGDLEIVTHHADSGEEKVERRRVVLKSIGRREEDESH